MPGTLFVVATPIGNLEDITLRALRVLREANVIAAEDTRRTARLLAKHVISTPTISFHEHNTRARLPQLIGRLQGGESIALVTDAGTPGVSDPGVELVQACIQAGIAVDPIPGVSAPLAAAVASGFPLTPLTIWGFAPSRAKDRTAWLRAVSETESTMTFFDSPHRVAATLREAVAILGDRPMMVARELTKVHQQFLHGTPAQLAEQVTNLEKGEFTIVIGPKPNLVATAPTPSDQDIFGEFSRLVETTQISRREAVSQTAQRLGLTPRQVYAAVERSKNR